MTSFRNLTPAEIAALETLGNSAEDWTKVTVAPDFEPGQLRQSHLEGRVEIARGARIVRSRVAGTQTERTNRARRPMPDGTDGR